MTDAERLIHALSGRNSNLRLHILEDGWIALHNVENTWSGRAKNYADAVQVIQELNQKQDKRCPTCNQEVPHE